MSKDSYNYRRIFDGGDALQAAAAVRAVFDVDVEDPFEQPGPTQARRRALRVIACGRGCLLWRTGDDFTTQLCGVIEMAGELTNSALRSDADGGGGRRLQRRSRHGRTLELAQPAIKVLNNDLPGLVVLEGLEQVVGERVVVVRTDVVTPDVVEP